MNFQSISKNKSLLGTKTQTSPEIDAIHKKIPNKESTMLIYISCLFYSLLIL